MFQFFSFVFNWLKSQVARVRFELARKAYIKAKRRVECADKVCDIPDDFGGGELFMDNLGRFFIAEKDNRKIFNTKIVEKLSFDEAADLAFASHFKHIDMERQDTVMFQWAMNRDRYFFGDSEFRYYLAQTA